MRQIEGIGYHHYCLAFRSPCSVQFKLNANATWQQRRESINDRKRANPEKTEVQNLVGSIKRASAQSSSYRGLGNGTGHLIIKDKEQGGRGSGEGTGERREQRQRKRT